jgi:hypothetical protein
MELNAERATNTASGAAKRNSVVVISSVRAKKWGSSLGPGAPEGTFHIQCRFHTGRVGSSILASLSEAGGNGP